MEPNTSQPLGRTARKREAVLQLLQDLAWRQRLASPLKPGSSAPGFPPTPASAHRPGPRTARGVGLVCLAIGGGDTSGKGRGQGAGFR
jgi:hypothetical protein